MKAKVYVTLKSAVLDPQGKAIERSLHRLGYQEVKNVRMGKYIQLNLNETDQNRASKRLEEMCKKLLSNPVIEDIRYEFTE